MLISIKINLPLEEKFNLLIKNRINNSYVNEDGDLINIYSSSEIINKELLEKGIDYKDKAIDDIILELSSKNHPTLRVQNRDYSEELGVLKDYMLELSFYLHDYDYDKMNPILQNVFKNLKQYSDLLRKHRFNF
ncbi:hypothetical protein [Flavobacterium xueshanense]|uniref:Uncharacterized protein n=1 Tax=Flavobacterium xueshanense TaxID=935223 RepID=A0A1I2EAY4_9FLAO|nr:hypothetical protein [Flavobacterium xueshanense]SFE90092.1 hypothetical protein SAMN04488131_105152 [Flavobacterium xueshanense]